MTVRARRTLSLVALSKVAFASLVIVVLAAIAIPLLPDGWYSCGNTADAGASNIFYIDPIDGNDATTATPLGWWSVAYTTGNGTPPIPGEQATGGSTGSTAYLTITPIISGGSWAGGDAAGTMYWYGKSAAFSAETLTFGTGGATCSIAGDFTYCAWKTMTSGATAARIAPGDTMRIRESPDFQYVDNATWTNRSKTVTLTTAQTKTVNLCETGWTGNANYINTVASAPTAGGSGYTVGDILTVTTGGTYGQAKVDSVDGSGAVLTVSQYAGGRGYSTGAGKATSGGTGDGLCTINITAVASGSSAAYTNTRKEGSYSTSCTPGSFTRLRTCIAYLNITDDNFSAYQTLSFWLWSTVSQTPNSVAIALCSDNFGAVVVDYCPIDLSVAPLYPGVYTVPRVGGGNLGASIGSIAVYSYTAIMQQYPVYVDDIIACEANGLSLISLISKNSVLKGGAENWYGIQSIVGTTVLLDNYSFTFPYAGRGYYGATETVATYMVNPLRPSVAIGGATTNVEIIQDSGSAGLLITYSGGWSKDTNTQTGESIYDAPSMGRGLYCAGKNYVRLEYIGEYRFWYGFYIQGGYFETDGIRAGNCYQGWFTSSAMTGGGVFSMNTMCNNENAGASYSSSGAAGGSWSCSKADGNTSPGINIYPLGTGGTVTVGEASNNGTYGVMTTNTPTGMSITVTQADYNGSTGVYLSNLQGSTAYVAEACHNALHGVHILNGSTNLVLTSDNASYNNGATVAQYGVYLQSVTACTVNAGACEYNGNATTAGAGVCFSGCNGCIVSATSLDHNTGVGLYLYGDFTSQATVGHASYNSTYGVSAVNFGKDNRITIDTANNNTTGGVYYQYNANNTLTFSHINNNGIGMNIQYSQNNRFYGGESNSNTDGTNGCGILIAGSGGNIVYNLSTSGNAVCGVRINFCGTNYLWNLTAAEGTVVYTSPSLTGDMTYCANMAGDPLDNRIYTTETYVQSQQTTAYVAGNTAWEVVGLGSSRTYAWYPVDFEIAVVNCESGVAQSYSCWVKMDHATNVGASIYVPDSVVTGVSFSEDNKTADTNWEQLTVNFVPSDNGTISVKARAWYIAGSSNAYFDTSPVIMTQAATNVTTTTAVVNGTITGANRHTQFIPFIDALGRAFTVEYDTDSGAPYASTWASTDNQFGNGTLAGSLSSLIPGTLYFYRAHYVDLYGGSYGSEQTFLTEPEAPTNLSATPTTDVLYTLTWTKGTGAQSTIVRGKVGSYPTDVSDGSLVYSGAGTGCTHAVAGEHWYYRAWSYVTDGGLTQYSDGSAMDSCVYVSSGTPLPPIPGPPTNFTATYVDDNVSVYLAWTMGTDNATHTLIQASLTGYPASTTEGETVYFGPADNCTDSLSWASVEAGTPVYYSAWSYNVSGFSLTYATATTAGGGGMANAMVTGLVLVLLIFASVFGDWKRFWPLIIVASIGWVFAGGWAIYLSTQDYDGYWIVAIVCAGIALATFLWPFIMKPAQKSDEPFDEEADAWGGQRHGRRRDLE